MFLALVGAPILAAARHATRDAAPVTGCAILGHMLDRQADPRTEDVIVFELLSTPRGATAPEVVGTATFKGGESRVDAPEAVRIAVEELLARAFVDRVQADERPRGYRRSGTGMVDMLVPGMPEHFIARLRGLWLSYPDGSVVTAREGGMGSTGVGLPEVTEAGPPITDPAIRRGTLREADRVVNAGPLVRAHAPDTGLRPERALAHAGVGPVSRTDCGWLV